MLGAEVVTLTAVRWTWASSGKGASSPASYTGSTWGCSLALSWKSPCSNTRCLSCLQAFWTLNCVARLHTLCFSLGVQTLALDGDSERTEGDTCIAIRVRMEASYSDDDQQQTDMTIFNVGFIQNELKMRLCFSC